ncbi:MAG TPA: sugar ABC transporter substrate-binding protein [Actinomycetota bacterium]|nr:sugar ABC transporter substrate-binding protein [Actinomycetota bacterium]
MKRTTIALLILGVALPACASDDGNDGADGAELNKPPVGEISFQLAGDPEEIVVYESLVESFQNANPDADVKLVPLADKDDHLAKLTTSFTAGNPPDVFLLNFREYSQFAETGAIDEIEPRLEELGISVDDYYDPPIDAFTYNGALQCMPQNISSLAVYYNKQLFKEAGLDAPQEGWSWEDFRQTAIALTSGDVRGVGIEPTIIRLAPFVWSNGGEIVDDPEQPTRFTLDDPAAREALEFFVQLAREDQVIPTEEEITAAEDLESMFAAGKLGMLLTSRRDTPEFREVTELKWDVAALPVAEEQANILHSDAYCVATGSAEPDVAFAFVKYATGEQGQTITALGGRTVPSLESVATSGAFLNPAEPPKNSQVFLDAIDGMRATPVIPTWPQIEDITEEFLTRAFYEEGYTVDDAIQDIEGETISLFEEGTG